MDRLEAFVKSNLLSHLTATGKCAIRVAGILLPSLPFSNDIVFMGTDMWGGTAYLRYIIHILCLKPSLSQFAEN